MKKVIFLALAATIVLTTACQKEATMTVPYAFGIIETNATGSELTKISTYIAGLGVPSGAKSYDSSGKGANDSKAIDKALSDADSQAKKDCDQSIAKFKAADIQALGLESATKFSWGCVRKTEPLNSSSLATTTIGEFKWNMN